MDSQPAVRNGRPDDEIELREIWNILMRNRWIIVASIVIAGGLGVAYSLLATPVYEASSSIRIDEEEQSQVAMLDILSSIAKGSQVETEMEVLRSRVVAEDVADSLALRVVMDAPRRTSREHVLAAVHATRAPLPSDDPVEYVLHRQDDGRFAVRYAGEDREIGLFAVGDPIPLEDAEVVLAPDAQDEEEIRLAVRSFDRTVSDLREDLTVTRPNQDANVVEVHYESTDRALARDVPNAIARTFIARRNQVQKTETRSTVAFLRDQIGQLSVQLAGAEDALRDFRERQQVVSLEDEASAQVQRLAEMQGQRDELDAERAALQTLVDEIRAATTANPNDPAPYRRLIAFPSLLRNQATSELFRSLNEADGARAELTKRFSASHPDVLVLSSRIRDLETQLRSIATTYLEGLTNQVASLDRTLARFGDKLEQIPAKEVQFARLKRQTSVLEQIYTLLQTRLKEAEIAEAVEDPSVRVVDPAIPPQEPIRPRGMLNLILALVLGGMVGVSVAFVRVYADTTVHTREHVQQATGAPVLGLIPSIRWEARRRRFRRTNGDARARISAESNLGHRLVTGHDPRNPISEAYRSLRTNITFLRPERTPKVIVFTSPTPGEGKSTTAANFAITLTQQGQRVLLVDADMRRGVLNSVFDIPREPGLSNVLLGHMPGHDAIRSVDLGESGTLEILATGTIPPNPAELLGSSNMRGLLAGFEEIYDAVILDSPPLNLVTDAAVLGTNADGVVVVARASHTQRQALTFAGEQLANVRATLLGSVLNDVDFERDARYYGGYGPYGHGYAHYYGRVSERDPVRAAR